MNLRTGLLGLAAFVAVTLSINAYSWWWPFSNKDEQVIQGDVTEILWDDLIPEDFVQPENPFLSMTEAEIDKLMDGSEESYAEIERLQKVFEYAPVVEELDGKRVKLPAYITPLDFNAESTIKEFLLVPYFGACVHVPPPPANQVVHAESDEPITFTSMYDPVWAVGVIRAETVKSELAESGYRLDVESVIPYSQ